MKRILILTICFIIKRTFGISSFPSDEINSLLGSLAKNKNQPSLWKRLGKLQLDAGEFAEARRIFCYGSSCCPDDDQLMHHTKVFRAFHEEHQLSSQNNNDDYLSTSNEQHPDLPRPPKQPSMPVGRKEGDLFLSFAIPPSEIPESIRNYPISSIPPESRNRLIHASTEPIIDKECCSYLIQEALRTTKHIGWTKDRHIQAPTCDVPVFDLESSAQQWVRDSLFQNLLFPLLCKLVAPEIQIKPEDLRVQDCFIVRYDAKEDDPGFSSLNPHQDESLLSLTIALNDMNEYDDGGLFIASTQDVLNGPSGTVLCFAGGLVHGGYPVSKGTRWILTVFLYVDLNQSGKENGYTLQELERINNKLSR